MSTDRTHDAMEVEPSTRAGPRRNGRVPMRLLRGDEDVDQALLHASDLADDFPDAVCVMAIGANGGVVCTDVRCHMPLAEAAMRRIATDAAIAVEASTVEGGLAVPMEDAEGRSVRLDRGDDHVAIRETLTRLPDDVLRDMARGGPPVWPLAASPIVLLVLAAMPTPEPTAFDRAVDVGFIVVAIAMLTHAIASMAAMTRRNAEMRPLSRAAGRETERRAELDALVARRRREIVA